MQRMIYIAGCDRWVTIGAYVKAIKQAKAHPDDTFKHTLCSWAPGTGRDILREFYRGAVDRINDGISYSQRA